MKNRITFLLFMLCAAAPVFAADSMAVSTAATVTVEAGGAELDLASVFSKLRGGTLCTFVPQGMTLATLYAPVLSYRDTAGLELVNFNAGAAINTADGKGSPLFSVGMRADGLLKKLTGGEWAGSHLTAANLPPLELAAAGMWYSPSHIWTLGLNVAVRFSE